VLYVYSSDILQYTTRVLTIETEDNCDTFFFNSTLALLGVRKRFSVLYRMFTANLVTDRCMARCKEVTFFKLKLTTSRYITVISVYNNLPLQKTLVLNSSSLQKCEYALRQLNFGGKGCTITFFHKYGLEATAVLKSHYPAHPHQLLLGTFIKLC
jgi:hypothetical protein